MPECSQCRMLFKNKCLAYAKAREVLGRSLELPPLGACVIPIVEDYLLFIKEGMRVLEIGCGSWDMIKNHCKKVGAHYEGIETQEEYFGRKTVATRIENLANLSFPNEYFDLVIGVQSMEHWPENECTLRWGLYQCFRVCKENGRVLLNVPIHFHGSKVFMLGNLEDLKKLFIPFSKQVLLNEWGNPSSPLPDLYPFPGYWVLRNKPAYVLDIQAIKDCPLPWNYSNVGAYSGLLAKLFNYPISFSLYKLLYKIDF